MTSTPDFASDDFDVFEQEDRTIGGMFARVYRFPNQAAYWLELSADASKAWGVAAGTRLIPLLGKHNRSIGFEPGSGTLRAVHADSTGRVRIACDRLLQKAHMATGARYPCIVKGKRIIISTTPGVAIDLPREGDAA